MIKATCNEKVSEESVAKKYNNFFLRKKQLLKVLELYSEIMDEDIINRMAISFSKSDDTEFVGALSYLFSRTVTIEELGNNL